MRVPAFFISFLVSILIIPSTSFAFRVVIDPGHGGTDLGTVYNAGRSRVREKDVTLKLAQRVAEDLRKSGYSVILTRTVDRDVPLAFRTALANKLHADVFLSIHMNSTPRPLETETAEGVETYILNNTTDALSKRLAQLENTVLSPADFPESDVPQVSDKTEVALILKDLRLDANLSESKRLACTIQSHLVNHPGRKARNRGIKQAMFHVLLGADMPSVLVEAGFLTSPNDRALVLSPVGQALISRSIANGVAQFQRLKGTAEAQSTLNTCKVN